MAKTIKPSLNTELIKRSACDVCVSCKRGNTSHPKNSVDNIADVIMIRHGITKRYGIKNGGFEILVRIAQIWLKSGKGSTVYEISKGDKNATTSNGIAVRRLHERGLLEVIGKGWRSASVYAPTKEALNELSGMMYNIAV